MKKAKSEKPKGLSPEEIKKKNEQKELEKKKKEQRVIANLEKQREKEKAEKAEREKKAKLEAERKIKDKLEKEEKIRLENERLRNRERERRLSDKVVREKLDSIKNDIAEKIKIAKEKVIEEWKVDEDYEMKDYNKKKAAYVEVMKNKDAEPWLVMKAQEDYELAEEYRKEREEDLKQRIRDEEMKCKGEMADAIKAITQKAMDDFPVESESEGESLDKESNEPEDIRSEIDETDITITEGYVTDIEEVEYEGIVHMKEKIKEIEKNCIAGTSKRKTSAEHLMDKETRDDVDNEEEIDMNEVLELGNLTDCDALIQKALDIQEAIVEISTSKECRKEVGRSMRTEVRKLMEIIIMQQKSLAHCKAKNEEINKLKLTENKKITYADKLKKGTEDKGTVKKKIKQRSKNVVGIYPTEFTTSKSTVAEVSKHVDMSKLKGGVTGIRHIRRGGIIIEVEEVEDVEKLITNMNENRDINEKYKAQKPTKRQPQIIIFNVNDDIEEIDIRRDLNKNIESIEKKEDIIFRKKYTGRNGNNWVLELSPQVFSEVIKLKRIKIGWMNYNFKENIKPILCFSCGRPGHVAKICNNIKICTKCGKEDHIREDCKVKEEECINCVFNNKKWGTNYDTKHSCFDRKCFIYKRECEKLISITDYLE